MQSRLVSVLDTALGQAPVLDLNFSSSKTLDSRITFSRGSTATFINSSGLVESAASGSARFTHDPVTLASLGLLIEESRTNLVTRSEEFSDASWSKYLATVSANAGTAPDGATTADLVYPSSSGSLAGQVFRSVSGLTAGNVVTASLFVKASGKTVAYLSQITGSFAPAAYYNLSTGAISNVSAGCTATIQQFPNGWWRLTLTSTVGAGTNYAVFGSCDAAGSTTNTANGTNGILAWGYQTEIGAFATSYIPTTSATATRAADVATMTGTNFSSWYRQDEGTLAINARLDRLLGVSGRIAISLDDNTISNRLNIGNGGLDARMTFVRVSGGVFQPGVNIDGVWGVGVSSIAAFAYYGDNAAVTANGAAPTSAGSGLQPVGISQLTIGATAGTSVPWCGTIARIRYYRRRLPDANLQTLTT